MVQMAVIMLQLRIRRLPRPALKRRQTKTVRRLLLHQRNLVAQARPRFWTRYCPIERGRSVGGKWPYGITMIRQQE